MKARSLVLVMLVMLFITIITTPANAKVISNKVINLDSHTQVVVSVSEPNALRAVASSVQGTWVPRDAKCVVKYWDDPWHKILDYKFTVHKHWEFNTTLNKVRRVQCCPGDCWINSTIKAAGGYAETYGAMDYLYTLPGGSGTGHYSERHAKFHCIIGIKGFGIPIGTWEVNVWFKVFSKNRPGTNQNWRCDVTKKWHYGSGS